MNLMQLMSNLGSIQEAAAPAMREIAETKALAGESVRLQRDILQTIRDQNDLLKGILECLMEQKPPMGQWSPIPHPALRR